MNGREVLEEALRQCCADYCEEIPRSEEDIDLGEDYEKYMNSLIRRSKKPFRRWLKSFFHILSTMLCVP